MKKSVGRVVGKLNEYLRGKEGKVMAVGPEDGAAVISIWA